LALVTGGSSGIGKQIAADLLRRGLRVVVLSHQPDRLVDAVAELSRVAPKVTSVTCDLSDRGAIREAANTVLREHGCPDVLVNNAGFTTYRTFEGSSAEEIYELVAVNFLGALLCTKAFLPAMIERRSGTVVNMASIAGSIAFTPNGTYSASKHGLVAWSEILRHELARFDIDVVVVCPGRVETPFFDHETFQTRARGPETRETTTVEAISRVTLDAIARRRPSVFVPRSLGFAAWAVAAAPFISRPILGWLMRRRVETMYDLAASRAVARASSVPTSEATSRSTAGARE